MIEGFLGSNTIVLGDLNAKHAAWGSLSSNNRETELVNLANDKAFLFLNDGTHTYHSHSYNSTDALDISMISPGLFPYSSWRVLDEVGSDHLPILIDIDFKVWYHEDSRLRWNFRRADWSLFEKLSEEMFDQSSPSEDLEREWSVFKFVVFSAAKASIPRGKYKGKKHLYVHMSDPVQPLIQRRSELLREAALIPSTDKKIELNKLNAEIKRRYVEIKRTNWQNTCRNLDHRTPNSRLWKLTKSLDKMPVNNEDTNAIVVEDGSTTVNDQETAEALAQHYAKASKVTFSRPDKGLARITRNLVKSCRDVKTGNPLFDVDFTADELSYALQQQDLTKCPGPDKIQGQFLNHLGTLGRSRLLHLFNLSWSTGKLPRQWKSAIVIPIRKPNKKASSADSYRPISLTCIVCKLIERILLRRLTHHLMTNNLIPPEQFAFRRGHGTMDQILLFSQSVRDAQNCKPTKHTLAVFLDLTKAFDRVWKYKLLNKCYNDFNIRGRALLWISNFLNHRIFA